MNSMSFKWLLSLKYTAETLPKTIKWVFVGSYIWLQGNDCLNASVHECSGHLLAWQTPAFILGRLWLNGSSSQVLFVNSVKSQTHPQPFCLRVAPSRSNSPANLRNRSGRWHQSTSEVSLPRRLIQQDRHADGSAAEQRGQLQSAGYRPASISYLPPQRRALLPDKMTLITLPHV